MMCRACNAPLRWALSRKGRRMPFDYEPHAEGEWTIREIRTPTETGYRMDSIAEPVGKGLEPAPPVGARYRSHFATCPEAARFRKG